MSQARTQRYWYLVEFEVEARHEEMASWLMIHKLGANGCQLFSAGNNSTVQASFELSALKDGNIDPIHSALDEYGLAKSIGSLRIKQIVEEDWLAEWKRGFQPIAIGNRLLIAPPWLAEELSPEQKSRHVVLIEPGLAFGTGFHTTTQFCLTALEEQCGSRAILDVGTGSGILAIAAAFLFPEAAITAVEIDPEACRVASENFVLNKVEGQIRLVADAPEVLSGEHYGLILSNLTCEDNVALLPLYLKLLEPPGLIIMSGILEEKSARMRAAISQHDLRVITDVTINGWTGFSVQGRQ